MVLNSSVNLPPSMKASAAVYVEVGDGTTFFVPILPYDKRFSDSLLVRCHVMK